MCRFCGGTWLSRRCRRRPLNVDFGHIHPELHGRDYSETIYSETVRCAALVFAALDRAGGRAFDWFAGCHWLSRMCRRRSFNGVVENLRQYIRAINSETVTCAALVFAAMGRVGGELSTCVQVAPAKAIRAT